MPKGNPGRLKSRFEIRGELVPNEYEFQQHHTEMTEQEHENFPPAEGQEGGASLTPQERKAARIAEIEARAHEIVERRRAKNAKSESKSAKKPAGKQSGAAKKNLAAKKSRGASKGRAAGGAKKSATKRAAKKGPGKASAKKGGKKGA